jgi:hypothetical protein
LALLLVYRVEALCRHLFESLNGLLYEPVGYDQHAYWMMKPNNSLNRTLPKGICLVVVPT